MITEMQMITLGFLSAIGLIALFIDALKTMIRISCKFILYALFILIMVYIVGYLEPILL